jgi:phage shock protein A
MREAAMAWRSRPATDAQRWLLDKIGLWAAGPGLNAAYRRQLLELTRVRRAVAGVATTRKRLELQIAEVERQASQPGDPDVPAAGASQAGGVDQGQTTRGITEQLADLRRRYADIQAKERRVTAASVRLQAEIDAFRTGQDATRAAYKAAEEAAKVVFADATGNQLDDGDATGEGAQPGRE